MPSDRRPLMWIIRNRRLVMAVLAVALVVTVALNVVLRWGSSDGTETVERDDDAVTVVDALAAAAGPARTVRGFVFEDQVGLRLCQARHTDPPACIGPYVTLRDLDPASLRLEEAVVDGRRFFHTPDPVTLLGVIDGVTMRVEDIVTAG